MQQRLYVDGSIPRHGQVKVNAEIVSGNAERCRGKRRRMNADTLVVQTPPVDFGVILPRPKADVAKLPRPDAAVANSSVGVSVVKPFARSCSWQAINSASEM